MEVNNGNEANSMEKREKVIQKWWIYHEGKSTFKHFGFSISVDRMTMDVLNMD